MDTNDKVLEMFDDYWEHIINRAKKELEIYRQSLFKSQSQAMQTLTQAVSMVVNDTITDAELRAFIFQMYPKEILQEALLITGTALRPTHYTYLFYLKTTMQILNNLHQTYLKVLIFMLLISKMIFKKY